MALDLEKGIELQVRDCTFSIPPVTCFFLQCGKIAAFWTIRLELEVVSKSSAVKMKLIVHPSYDVIFKLVD